MTTGAAGILDDPELKLWADAGVTEKQLKEWMREFDSTSEEIVASLRYAAHDILKRNNVKNPVNSFYQVMIRDGRYPRPQSYAY